EMEEICGRHLGERGVQELASERRRRRRQRRLQQPRVAQPVAAAVALDLIAMELDHFLDGEEDRRHSARRRKTAPYLRCASATIFLSFACRLGSRTGEMMIVSPLVDTWSRVSASMWVSARIALSSTSARLLPVFVS